MEKQIMLIVDDMELNRQLLTEYFQQDYTIVCACNGQEATEKIRACHREIAIILLDILIPVMDGIAVLQWMAKESYCDIPVIAITADSNYQLDALQNGAWDFIANPTENKIIRARVQNVLSRYALTRERRRNAALSRQQQEMQYLLNSIPGGIATCHLVDGRLETLYFSDGVAALCGYTREEYTRLAGNNAAAIIYEEDRKRLQDAAVETLKTGQSIDETYRIHDKSGHLTWVRITGIPAGTDADAPLIHVIYQRPPRMAQLYANLVNESKNLIYVSDIGNYDLLYMNHTGLDVFAPGTSDYSGKKCYEFCLGALFPARFAKLRR